MQVDESEEKHETETERITRQPQVEAKLRIKDPRRVAAGKALGESNKRAREALKRETEALREASRKDGGGSHAMARVGSDESPTRLPHSEAQGAWIPSLDLPTIISIVGIGITVFQMYRAAKSEYSAPAKHVTISRPTLAPNPNIEGGDKSDVAPLGMD